ncbi:hypothetical protein CASFOL_039170 [Castilleja foliolosa]|uniref:Protein CHUP1, chloroplastic-like n=1 Tax=Castilleja foliolosa TaxID=1961234 RepID=A0ABD3BH78_9LAMI
MREENSSENRTKASKFADQNQAPKNNHHGNIKGTTNFSKMKSSWGSQIVKGFSAADKKTKTRVVHVTAAQTKKLPLDLPPTQKNPQSVSNSRIKRSLIGDLSCSVTATQVHPQAQNKSKSSEDLFHEIDHLRNLLQESRDREVILQESKKSEIEGLLKKVESLESEKACLAAQVVSLGSQDEIFISEVHDDISDLEMEVLELRRLNKELQLQKRNLSVRVSILESQLAKVSESDMVEKIKAEASLLRQTNGDLTKQVEGLQISRMNEVEELAYLKWVNSCLRDELRSCSNTGSPSTPKPTDKRRESICLSPYQLDEDSNASKKLYLIKKFKKWTISDEALQQSSARRHSISGTNCSPEDLLLINNKRQSDSFICSKEAEKRAEALVTQKYDLEVSNSRPDVQKRALRVPNPPPRPSCSDLAKEQKRESSGPGILLLPPPPPPPPMKLMARSTAGKVQRAPQVVEFYHSLMKRESRKDCLSSSGTTDGVDVANVRSSMIGEIENRSSHLLAIKADVETQGEFVNSLIREVNDAVYQNIEDVVAFVKWLDDELCFLVDERAVLKHFEWPEKKADTLREAAFGYRDLRRLEQEVSNYKDDPRLPCDIALKKMAALSERMERSVHNILRTRDALMRHCKEFHIPTDWMLDNGILSKIKFGSVKLAKMYMTRVAMELQSKGGASDKDSSLDYMLLQGVRFAFRIHQFAGGFDAETMHAFEELRDLAVVLNRSRD